jgi:hypothetical protein
MDRHEKTSTHLLRHLTREISVDMSLENFKDLPYVAEIGKIQFCVVYFKKLILQR